MSDYNPYGNLAAFAAINLLKDEDPHSEQYPVLEVCACIGAVQASMWLVAGKPCSKAQFIDLVMSEVEPLVLNAPFPRELVRQVLPLDLARSLIERGFDWLVKYEIEDMTTTTVDIRRTTEAI